MRLMQKLAPVLIAGTLMGCGSSGPVIQELHPAISDLAKGVRDDGKFAAGETIGFQYQVKGLKTSMAEKAQWQDDIQVLDSTGKELVNLKNVDSKEKPWADPIRNFVAVSGSNIIGKCTAVITLRDQNGGGECTAKCEFEVTPAAKTP